jgi:uncharacterized protein YcfJ
MERSAMARERFPERERRIVASYATAAEAEEAVQILLDRKIDADCVTVTRAEVVAPTREQQAPDRLQRILVGAVIGGLLGSAIGLALGMNLLTLPGLALGAFIGAWIAPVMHLSERATGMPTLIETERHDVVTSRDRAQEARRMLREARFG